MKDIRIAELYVRKGRSAESRNIPWSLGLFSFINLMRSRKCAYTGINLTEPRTNAPALATDRTLDRIDNSIGYHRGNVKIVCHAANQIKSIWENPNNPLTKEMVRKITCYK